MKTSTYFRQVCGMSPYLAYSRAALFIIYAWFGALKVLGFSPANPLVDKLLAVTMPFMTFSTFIVLFGIFEVIIGILFLFPKLTKITTYLFAVHMVTTFLPLVLLTTTTWSAFLVPTLEGQYIIKNLALIAVVASLRKSS
jgi:uncharacterized membrane protein YkgB